MDLQPFRECRSLHACVFLPLCDGLEYVPEAYALAQNRWLASIEKYDVRQRHT